MTDVLRTVTDRFCLYKNARTGTQNGRQYVLSAVRAMLEKAETKEGLVLGEHFGYYGHGRREMTKKLDLPETSVIMVEGRPVVIDNVPACRTVAISVDDDGIVTHTQEILNTEPGKIVAAMLDSKAGGWSWATGGRQAGSVAVTTSFHGFDYVTNPNYVSLDHPASVGLFESADGNDQLLESLAANGLSQASSEAIATHFSRMSQFDMMYEASERNRDLETQLLEKAGHLLELENSLAETQKKIALLESAKSESRSVTNDLIDSLNNLPIFISHAQRKAFKLKTPNDAEIVHALLESLIKTESFGLPLGKPTELKPKPAISASANMVSFKKNENPFSK